jgi:hypothetical protein
MRGGALERRCISGGGRWLVDGIQRPVGRRCLCDRGVARIFEHCDHLRGVVALGIQGNYTYFGTVDIGPYFPDLLAIAVVLIGVIADAAGRIFCWLLLNTGRRIPSFMLGWRVQRTVAFGAGLAC